MMIKFLHATWLKTRLLNYTCAFLNITIVAFQAERFPRKQKSLPSRSSVKKKQLKVNSGSAVEALLELTSDMTESDNEKEMFSVLYMSPQQM